MYLVNFPRWSSVDWRLDTALVSDEFRRIYTLLRCSIRAVVVHVYESGLKQATITDIAIMYCTLTDTDGDGTMDAERCCAPYLLTVLCCCVELCGVREHHTYSGRCAPAWSILVCLAMIDLRALHRHMMRDTWLCVYYNCFEMTDDWWLCAMRVRVLSSDYAMLVSPQV